MKKLRVFILISILFIFSSCNQGSHPTQKTQSKQTTASEQKTYSLQLSKDVLEKKIQKVLPSEIFENLTDYMHNLNEDGDLYIWSQSNLQTGDYIHKIELIASGGVITRFHYKSYDFTLERKPISMNDASLLVNTFAAEFIESHKVLLFENKPLPNSNLYNPGTIEGWVAQKDGKEYVIIVNLLQGYVISFDVNTIAE